MTVKVRAAKRVGGKRRRAWGVSLMIAGVIMTGIWGWSLRADLDDCSISNLARMRSVGWHLSISEGSFNCSLYVAEVSPQDGESVQSGLVYVESIKRVGRLHVPIWPLAITGFVAGVWLFKPDWYRLFAAKPGHCRRCSYDFVGLKPGAPCPECGMDRVRKMDVA